MGTIQDHASIQEASPGERRKILVVGRDDGFTPGMMDYAIHLAERLGYELLAVNVGVGFEKLRSASHRANLCAAFRGRSAEAVALLKEQAADKGIRCEHVVRFGTVGGVVEELIHEVRRIEFVVTESEANREELSREVTIPVFSVLSGKQTEDEQGGRLMANEAAVQKRPYGKVLGYGLVTAALYAAVFSNADAVMQLFTKGGWYSALPITTVFVFSFAHGAFASNLWSMLGIEALKKDTKTEKKVAYDRTTARKRPRVAAYVNPFHKL